MEKIDQADHQLADRSDDLSTRVHGTRKRIKEIRATLRLARGEMSRHEFSVQNRWFRDAARELSQIRDANAAVAAFDKVRPLLEGRVGTRTIERINRFLAHRRDLFAASNPEITATLDDVGGRLALARRRLAESQLEGDDVEVFASGLEATYRRARAQWRKLLRKRSVSAVHQWRKLVKDHWYHTQILREIWPQQMRRREKELEDLSKILGDHHDLTLILTCLTEVPRLPKRVPVLLNEQLGRLENEAMEQGEKLFALKPSRFLQLTHQAWNDWRERTGVEAEARRISSG